MAALTRETFAGLTTAEQIVRLEQVDAKTRRELILQSRNSVSLTRALSSEKLFYTLKEIGLADAVDLLALASPEQMRDMLDLDCWRKDTLDERRVAAWLMLLDEAGSGKLAEWALHADIELLVLLVKRFLEVVRKIEVEEDMNFDQSQYFTFDDQYLLRFIGEPEPILASVIERLRVLDYENYRQVLEWSMLELESTLEEDTLHWRNARLADRGYPGYEQAQKLFRVVDVESVSLDRFRRATTPRVRYAAGEDLIFSDHALMLLEVRDSLLVRALASLSGAVVEEIGQELAMLTNEAVVAQARDPGEVAEVKRCVEEVHDYVNIGLAYFAQENDSAAARLVREIRLRPFFQVGFSLTTRLQQYEHALQAVARAHAGEAWETLLDTPFREACAGVRRQPPMFFRGLDTPGEIFLRRFRDFAEVRRMERLLEQIPLWFAVLNRCQLLPDHMSEQVSLATLWNTAFAHWTLAAQVDVRPLTRAEFVAFRQGLRGTVLNDEQERFLAFLAAQASVSTEERQALQVLAACARERLEEALSVNVEGTDLRFLEGLLVVG
ncbi:MAG: hypothetical protein HYZ50_23040 [Deltaproteobacteria bacterium]|nr:hypothetical protein [Deltaproteobacteria bacterium]